MIVNAPAWGRNCFSCYWFLCAVHRILVVPVKVKYKLLASSRAVSRNEGAAIFGVKLVSGRRRFSSIQD